MKLFDCTRLHKIMGYCGHFFGEGFYFLFMNRFKEQKSNAMAQTAQIEREDLA